MADKTRYQPFNPLVSLKTLSQAVPGSVKRRIFLVEDHPITRIGFANLLNIEPDLEVCAQAGSAQEALATLETTRPDLAIVDISLAGRSGLDLIKDISSRFPELLILVLSTYDETLYAERSLRAGAKGYIMKSASTELIFHAIREILSGKIYLSKLMNERLLLRLTKSPISSVVSEIEHLTDRELEIFSLMGQGQSTSQIAQVLKLSTNTVATHRAHIQEKLGLESLNELLCCAAQWIQPKF